MKKTKTAIILILISSVPLFILAQNSEEQCTSAVISPQAARDSIPILWKNRDTGILSNKVVYVNGRKWGHVPISANFYHILILNTEMGNMSPFSPHFQKDLLIDTWTGC